MAPTLTLPRFDQTLAPYTLTGRVAVTPPAGPIRSRVAFAAVHVVADPLADINPTLETALDWEATLAFRRHVWSLGLAVAEAMDTSQRGMGFAWDTAKELIRRTVAEARTVPGAVVFSGAGTDDLAPAPRGGQQAPSSGRRENRMFSCLSLRYRCVRSSPARSATRLMLLCSLPSNCSK